MNKGKTLISTILEKSADDPGLGNNGNNIGTRQPLVDDTNHAPIAQDITKVESKPLDLTTENSRMKPSEADDPKTHHSPQVSYKDVFEMWTATNQWVFPRTILKSKHLKGIQDYHQTALSSPTKVRRDLFPTHQRNDPEIQGKLNNIKEAHRICKRKGRKPQKSPSKFDPKFKGVSLRLTTRFEENESHLKVSANFSLKKPEPYNPRRSSVSPRSADAYDSYGSDIEPPEKPIIKKYVVGYQGPGKQCASCSTRKTPLWRDAEDGTPLCNACGIRYKKYRIRCNCCWHIPKKESKFFSRCYNCGENLKVNIFRKVL